MQSSQPKGSYSQTYKLLSLNSCRICVISEDLQLHGVASDPIPIKECVTPEGAMGSVAVYTIPMLHR